MMLSSILFLVAAALLPPLVLLRVVYQMDKLDREPGALLLALFFRGALAMVPILVLEVVADPSVKLTHDDTKSLAFGDYV